MFNFKHKDSEFHEMTACRQSLHPVAGTLSVVSNESVLGRRARELDASKFRGKAAHPLNARCH